MNKPPSYQHEIASQGPKTLDNSSTVIRYTKKLSIDITGSGIEQQSMIEELDSMECLISPASSPNKHLEKALKQSYKDILISSKDSKSLVYKFIHENYSLRVSDANRNDFSLFDSIERMIKGYNMIMMDYHYLKPVKVFVVADAYGVIVKRPFALATRMPYEYFGGVNIGATTSTFKLFKENGGSLNMLGLENTDCFSLIGRLHSFDFATHSDQAKYDFIQVVSYYISSYSSMSSPCIPLNKRQLSLLKLKNKIKEMANDRHITVKELLILAIIKSLIIRNECPTKINKIYEILNISLSSQSRMLRLYQIMKFSNIKPAHNYIAGFENICRVNYLYRRLSCFIDKTRGSQLKIIGRKQIYRDPGLIPSFKISLSLRARKEYKALTKQLK